MLEKPGFCRVRHVLYLSSVTAASALWLLCFGSSPPCTETRGRSCVYWTGLPPSPGRVQCDHSVWHVEFARGATLSPSEKLWVTEVSETRWPALCSLCWRRRSWSSLPPSWPATATQYSSISAVLSGLCCFCLSPTCVSAVIYSRPCPVLVSKEKNVCHFTEAFLSPIGRYK